MCMPLTEKDFKAANERVKKCLECEPDSCQGQPQTPTTRGKYNDYTPELRAHIGKYTAEYGPTRVAKHFSQLLKREPTARRLKAQYLQIIEELRHTSMDENTPLSVDRLPTKSQGRPVLIGQTLDKAVQLRLRHIDEVSGRGHKHCNHHGSCPRNNSSQRLRLTCATWWPH